MNADIKIENGRFVYGLDVCFCAPDGTVLGSKACPKCKGTGRTKGGIGKGYCRQCNGFKTVTDHDRRVTCAWGCNGSHYVKATRTSYLPDHVYRSFTFKVYRSGRPQTINERLYGAGLVFSCTDYGKHTKMTDDALIAHVTKHSGVQACKLEREDGVLANHVGIFCNANGYSVGAVFEEPRGCV